MYFILVLGRDPKGCKFWGILISFFAPSILLGLLAVALPNQILTVTPQIYPGHEEVGPFCYVPFKPYKLIMFGNTFLQLLLVLYLNKKVMDIRPAFNEFKENQLAFWILLTMLSASFGLNFGAHQVWYGKMIISFANLIASNVLVWVILAKPVWGCYRYPKEYLAQWKTGLRDENLPPQLLYGVRMNSILSF
jgi:hypothetical protein